MSRRQLVQLMLNSVVELVFVRSAVRVVMPCDAPYRQVCWMKCWIEAAQQGDPRCASERRFSIAFKTPPRRVMCRPKPSYVQDGCASSPARRRGPRSPASPGRVYVLPACGVGPNVNIPGRAVGDSYVTVRFPLSCDAPDDLDLFAIAYRWRMLQKQQAVDSGVRCDSLDLRERAVSAPDGS